MGIDGRRATGPLTIFQLGILRRLAEGDRQKDIARDHGTSASYISDETSLAIRKMAVKTTAEAVAIYAAYKAYMECSVVILGGLIENPVDDTEEHVNHVLRGISAELQGAANRMLPE